MEWVAGAEDTNFIAQAEFFTLQIDHSFVASGADKSGNARGKAGVGGTANLLTPCHSCSMLVACDAPQLK